MKHGSVLFVRNEFNIHDKGTWMSVPIRSVLNVDNVLEGKSKIRYNHVVCVVEKDGLLYIYQAGWNKENGRAEVVNMLLGNWLKDRNPNSYLVKNPIFEFDRYEYTKALDECLGKGYGFYDVLVAHPVRLLTGKRLWIGTRGTKTVFCNKLYSYAMHRATKGLGQETYASQDPEDLFLNNLFQ